MDPMFVPTLANVLASPRKGRRLPHPPFMVSSVIDHLRGSKWASLVDIVPGEADDWCAAHARISDIGVLSNDSDIVVFDLSPGSCLLLLHSLDVTSSHMSDSRPTISCKALNPTKIAQRLKVRDLQHLGFERFLDPSASFGVVKQRVTDPARSERLRANYENFLTRFDTSKIRIGNPSGGEAGQPWSCLDSRLAEVLFQFEDPSSASGGLHSYLPILVEDPSRDGSWTHGRQFRQLAYSVLNVLMPRQTRAESVLEFQRRGARINSVAVELLAECGLNSRLSAAIDAIQPPGTSSFDHVGPATGVATTLSPPTAWRLIALREVIRQRDEDGKAPLSNQSISRFCTIRQTGAEAVCAAPRQNHELSRWDDVHLTGNVQAVLYSLRMLQQTTRLALALASPSASGSASSNTCLPLCSIKFEPSFVLDGPSSTIQTLRRLHHGLASMPGIAELM